MADPKFSIFKDVSGHYRWHLIAGNGTKIATSGEAFYSKENAIRAATNVKAIAPSALVVDEEANALRRLIYR